MPSDCSTKGSMESNGSSYSIPPKPFDIVSIILQRGALINATLSSTSYRRSPSVQGGMEIPCRVSVWMPETLKNRAIVEKYKEYAFFIHCVIAGLVCR